MCPGLIHGSWLKCPFIFQMKSFFTLPWWSQKGLRARWNERITTFKYFELLFCPWGTWGSQQGFFFFLVIERSHSACPHSVVPVCRWVWLAPSSWALCEGPTLLRRESGLTKQHSLGSVGLSLCHMPPVPTKSTIAGVYSPAPTAYSQPPIWQKPQGTELPIREKGWEWMMSIIYPWRPSYEKVSKDNHNFLKIFLE